MYSRYVVESLIDGSEYLYHTLLGTRIPKYANIVDLQNNLFLSGQEQEALDRRLFSRINRIKFFFIPTWECTLRCPFCFVLKQLKKRDDYSLDPYRLDQFLQNYFERYDDCPLIEVCYLGGEPLLHIDNCISMSEVTKKFSSNRGIELSTSITTNGTVELSKKELDFLGDVDKIMVSIDGDESHHNAQRKVFDNYLDDSPFIRSLKFLNRLVDEGLSDKLYVNAALQEDILEDKDRISEFLFVLEAIGVSTDRISLSCMIPTRSQEATRSYTKHIGSGFVFPNPCCCFQYMSYFCLHGNKLYGNYYDVSNSLIAELDDPIDLCETRYREYIKKTMPVLHDDNCLECPVIGYCWGGCAHSETMKVNPSRHCGQQELIRKVDASARSGDIETFGQRYRNFACTTI